MVGLYALNLSQEWGLLWQSLAFVLKHGRPGIHMGKFNICYQMNQSTSPHPLMDALEVQTWEQFEVEVLKCDHIWNWIDGTIPRYTFQYVEYRFTRSRLHQMYIMHENGTRSNETHLELKR